MKLNFAFALLMMTAITLIHADFVFYQGFDSDGGDFQNIPGQSVDQLKGYCQNNANCLGFNTNGWLKSSLKPINQWNTWTNAADKGFYLKIADFGFIQGVDSDGGDITNLPGKTVVQLKAYCNTNPDCLGFNTNGWVKSSLKPLSQWSSWTNAADKGFYIKVGDFAFSQGVDSDGGDITNLPGKSVVELKAYCTANPSCLGFNTNGWVKSTIRPRNQWSSWTNDADKGFYLKQGQYVFTQGLDSPGGDIERASGHGVNALKAYCNSDPTCLGFNTNGWLKKELKPQAQWNRWTNANDQGFYAKAGAPVTGRFLLAKSSARGQKILKS